MADQGIVEYIKDNIWIKEHPIHFSGFDFYTRMTIVRLRNKKLFVHSPVRITELEKARIDALGEVKYIVAPSKLHHVFVEYFSKLYPGAQTYATAGLQKKRKDFHFHKTLTGTAPAEWSGEIDQVLMEGNSVLEEVEFYHKAAKVLIATDLFEHFPVPPDNANSLFKFLLKLFPGFKKGTASPEFRLFTFNKKAARRSFEKLFSWDIKRAVIAHGEMPDRGVTEKIKEAYKWLL